MLLEVMWKQWGLSKLVVRDIRKQYESQDKKRNKTKKCKIKNKIGTIGFVCGKADWSQVRSLSEWKFYHNVNKI